MARFVTIGYGDEAGYQRTAPDVRDAAHAHDARLADGGVEMGRVGTPVQVRNHDAAVGQPRVVRVRGIPNVGGGALVARLVAVPDRHEPRHGVPPVVYVPR